MITPGDQFGPWAQDLDPVERVARCRTLRAITHLCCGARGGPLAAELHRTEQNDQALGYAHLALSRLAPLDRRRVLATYAHLSRPA